MVFFFFTLLACCIRRICPLDLKEAISSLIFASPRCSDLPELLQIRQLFAAKYGKEFAAAAAELRPDCGVNRRVGLLLLYCWNIPFSLGVNSS